jgi:hypothetical protein
VVAAKSSNVRIENPLAAPHIERFGLGFLISLRCVEGEGGRIIYSHDLASIED